MEMHIIVEEDFAVYPFMIIPIFVSSQRNIQAIDEAYKKDKQIFVAFFKEGSEEEFYKIGVVGEIMRKVALPDGRVKILFRGIGRGMIEDIITSAPLLGNVVMRDYKTFSSDKLKATFEVLKEQLGYLANVNHNVTNELIKAVEESSNLNRTIDLIASSLKLPKTQAFELFAKDDVQERMILLIEYVVADI